MARFAPPRLQYSNASGAPLAGAKLFFYLAGTSTATGVYSDSDLTTLHASPVVADSAGMFPDIFLSTLNTYKAVLKRSDDTTVWTADDYAPADGGAVGGRVTLESFGCVGDNVTSDSAALQLAFDSGLPLIGTPGAEYLITTGIYRLGGVDLDLNGAKIVDQVEGNCIYCELEFTELQQISAMSTVDLDSDDESANTSESTRITVTDASKYAVGDRIKIMSKDLLSGPDPADSERQGEYANVLAIDTVNNYIYTTAPLKEAYSVYATDPRVARMADRTSKFRIVNGYYTTSDLKQGTFSAAHAAIRCSGFGYGNVEVKITSLRSLAVLFLSESNCGIGQGDVVIRAYNANTDPSRSMYGYAVLDNAGDGNYFIVYVYNVRHGITSGSGAAHATDYTQTAIKQCGRTRNFTFEVMGEACTASPADTHPDAKDGVLIVHNIINGYRGTGGSDTGVGIRGIGIVAYFLGIVMCGRSIQVTADYDHPDNCRDITIIAPNIRLQPTSEDNDRYPITVIGKSATTCRNIVIRDLNMISRGGAYDQADIFCQFGELTLENPRITWDGKALFYANSKLLETGDSGTIRVRGGMWDLRTTTGSGAILAKCRNANSVIDIDGFTVLVGAADKISYLADKDTEANDVIIRNLKLDYQPSVTYGASVLDDGGGLTIIERPTLTTHPAPQSPKTLEGSLTTDLASVPAGGFTTLNIPVYCAQLGDFVKFTCSVSTAGLRITPYVSAANMVTLAINNFTASPIDLASATWSVYVTALSAGFGGYDLDYVELSGSAAYNPPFLASNARTTTTITVTGARVGDIVSCISMDIDTLKVLFSGVVTADDTVEVALDNRFGSSATLASGGNLYVRVLARKFIWVAAAYDPASLANGSGDEITVAVPGARLGDFVEHWSFSKSLQGMQARVAVSATNASLVRVENETGAGPVNLNALVVYLGIRRRL